jgi:hypothetical protein
MSLGVAIPEQGRLGASGGGRPCFAVRPGAERPGTPESGSGTTGADFSGFPDVAAAASGRESRS